jgi:hypothetical protein
VATPAQRAGSAAAANGRVVRAGAAASTAPLQAPAAAARGAAHAAVLAALLSFLRANRKRSAQWLQDTLARRAAAEARRHPGVTLDGIRQDLAAVIAEEMRREDAFARASGERVAGALPQATAIADPRRRDAAIAAILDRERQYAVQRQNAMASRALNATDRVVLRVASPQGAFWKLDPTVIEHTRGCLIMGGKFWHWPVLDRVHPPRHQGCPCRLVSYGDAIADGLMSVSDVRDLRTETAAASDVVMELDDAERIMAAFALDELREALISKGMTTPEQFDAVAGRVLSA